MSVRTDMVLIMPDSRHLTPQWLYLTDGTVSEHGIGKPPAHIISMQNMVFTVILPPAATVIRTYELPDLPHAQGAAVAQRQALDASLGDTADCHSVAARQQANEHRHVTATIGTADMQWYLDQAKALGREADAVIPAGLLLQEHEDGQTFVRARIGHLQVTRGKGTCLPANDPATTAIIGSASIQHLAPSDAQSALLRGIYNPPLNLRTGRFAYMHDAPRDFAAFRRIARWVMFILLLNVVITLVQIAKYHFGAERLDAQTISRAGDMVENPRDAAEVENALNARLAALGIGGHGFSGMLSALMQAMRPEPSVSLDLLNRSADGLLQARLVSDDPGAIDRILFAMENAGFRITQTSSIRSDGRVASDITVTG